MVKDISGQRFGRLVAIQPTMMRSCTYVVWECKCDCGNTVLVASNQLRNGNTKSCGCLRKDYITKELTKDLTGQRFGRLVALKPAEKRKSGYVMWECKCDCGNTIITIGSNLRNGSKLSCGCLQKERAATRATIDITGQRFGELVALGPTEERRWNQVVWECRCDCGKTTYATSTDLVNGSTKSCGCLSEESTARNRRNDLTGQRFGRLVAVCPTTMRSCAYVVWECKCDCGRTVSVPSNELKKGKTKSCGCLRKDYISEVLIGDLTGQRFGRLVAVKPTEERKNRFVMWECKCDCGNTVSVRSGSLTSGKGQSCGCLRKERKKKD